MASGRRSRGRWHGTVARCCARSGRSPTPPTRASRRPTATPGPAAAKWSPNRSGQPAAGRFDAAEAELGPVDILVNNASGWVADTFAAAGPDRLGRSLRPVSAQTSRQLLAVDAMAPALLISEFARRHIGRGAAWGRIIGLTSGGPLGFP